MSPEELARVEAGVEGDIDISSPKSEEVLEQIDETADDIDELSEQLAVSQIISEERHDEILARVDECLAKMEQLTTIQSSAENPMLTQILASLTEMRVELESLKLSVADMKIRQPSESLVSEPVSPEEPSQERLMEEPSVESVVNPPEKPARKNRFI